MWRMWECHERCEIWDMVNLGYLRNGHQCFFQFWSPTKYLFIPLPTITPIQFAVAGSLEVLLCCHVLPGKWDVQTLKCVVCLPQGLPRSCNTFTEHVYQMIESIPHFNNFARFSSKMRFISKITLDSQCSWCCLYFSLGKRDGGWTYSSLQFAAKKKLTTSSHPAQ